MDPSCFKARLIGLEAAAFRHKARMGRRPTGVDAKNASDESGLSEACTNMSVCFALRWVQNGTVLDRSRRGETVRFVAWNTSWPSVNDGLPSWSSVETKGMPRLALFVLGEL